MYLTSKKYTSDCSANHKRIIKKKPQKFQAKIFLQAETWSIFRRCAGAGGEVMIAARAVLENHVRGF